MCRLSTRGAKGRLITLAMATEIAASRHAVWAAVSDPEQERHWRPGVSDRLADQADGSRTRHRFRLQLHDVPVILEESRIASVSQEQLRSELRLGLFRFEETFSLVRSGPAHTRLGVKVIAPSEMPLVGGNLDRFDVRRFATDLVAVTLQAVRDWCERGEAPRLDLPDFPQHRRSNGVPSPGSGS